MFDITVVDGFLFLLVSCLVLRLHIFVFLHTDSLVNYLLNKLTERK